jgi:hypothetical protein
MIDTFMPYYGNTRIKNPKTLQKWIDNGWFKENLNNGYTFAPACGRFRIGKCECSACRKSTRGDKLKSVLEKNNLNL